MPESTTSRRDEHEAIGLELRFGQVRSRADLDAFVRQMNLERAGEIMVAMKTKPGGGYEIVGGVCSKCGLSDKVTETKHFLVCGRCD